MSAHDDDLARPDASLGALCRTIEAEVIPRLMLLRSRPAPRTVARTLSRTASAEFGTAAVEAFVKVVLDADTGTLLAHVDRMRAEGVPLQTIYLDMIAPAARRIGVLWEEDRCDFTAVTTGLGRLQTLLRELSPEFRNEIASTDISYRVLLLPQPGDQHTFGVIMVAEFFLQAGWDVWGGPMTTRDDLARSLRGKWFDLVGLSLGTETMLDEFAQLIRLIRRSSCNRSVLVMVGGPVFVGHPELAAAVGADATAVDGRQAPIQAEKLISQLAARS